MNMMYDALIAYLIISSLLHVGMVIYVSEIKTPLFWGRP